MGCSNRQEQKGKLTGIPLPQGLLTVNAALCIGCGRCTLSCPAQPTDSQELRPYAADAWLLATMPSGELTRLIRGSILQRTGATLLKRNAVAAIANQTPPDQWPEARDRLLAATSSPTVIDTLNA